MSERHKRQSDIISPNELDIPIHIIGCGGIGSWATLLLAKMGCPDITVYDFDKVEEHNVASQFYKQSQTGLPKTEMLKVNVYEQSGIEIKTANVEQEKDILGGIIVIAVDSMEARRQLADQFQNSMTVIVDGRMGGLQAELYIKSSEDYKDTLVSEDNVEQGRCTERSISFNCALIGSLIANAVRLVVKNPSLDNVKHLSDITFLFDSVSVINPNVRQLKERE